MIRIPASALLLGVAGLIPFIWGALVTLGYVNASIGDPAAGGYSIIAATDGSLLMIRYGGIILPFMSGILWGFATKAEGNQSDAAYALSVLPAIWWFLMPGTDAPGALINLMIGFSAVLLLDLAFQRWDLAPPWWMSLRIPLTIVVLICLAIGVWA